MNQTLSRTIITAGTTFLAVVSLYLFGGEVLEGFAFTMLVGIVTGSYSTIYIASPIVLWLQRRGAGQDLAAIYRLEYIVALHCAAHGDFAEGIRALLIDKD